MNTKLYTITFTLCFLVVLVCCTTVMEVHYDYNKSVDFTKYKTFRMYALTEKTNTMSGLNKDRIISAIRNEMNRKGFSEQESDPDLYVNPVVILRDKKVVTANTDYYGYGGVYRPYAWSDNMSTTRYNVYTYTDGSLSIDVLDARTGKLIWEGTGNREVDGRLENPDQEIPAAVTKIMEHFPPTPADAQTPKK